MNSRVMLTPKCELKPSSSLAMMRLPQQRRDLVVADHHAPFDREFADHFAAGGIDPRDGARRVIIERGDLRQVAGKDEQDAARAAEQRGQHEEDDDRRLTGDADDDPCHDAH